MNKIITIEDALTLDNIVRVRSLLLQILKESSLTLNILNPILDSAAVALCIDLHRMALKNKKKFSLGKYPPELKALFNLYHISHFS